MRGAAAAALLALAAAARAEPPIPPLAGPVVDAAGLLSAGDERRLSELARSARAREDGQGVQLQYLIVRSLDGVPIEDYSIRVAEAWRLGTKGRDNGLLVTVAVEDRAFRIEVGGGLEGEIPDALARRIGDRLLVPAFRAGRFADGLYDAGAELLTLAGVAPEDVQARARRRDRGVTRMPSGLGVLVAIFVILWIVSNVFRGFGPRRRRHLWWGGGPWIGGGWGGGGGLGGFGGGGGGGWSGGGGGFSGGGASGRW
ncbi:MAG TPA: TPM domain-containing protein [Anaeromyxobacter sp.]|nr:TPM domain-containing protein [Anaeromyxobacter sp.]